MYTIQNSVIFWRFNIRTIDWPTNQSCVFTPGRQEALLSPIHVNHLVDTFTGWFQTFFWWIVGSIAVINLGIFPRPFLCMFLVCMGTSMIWTHHMDDLQLGCRWDGIKTLKLVKSCKGSLCHACAHIAASWSCAERYVWSCSGVRCESCSQHHGFICALNVADLHWNCLDCLCCLGCFSYVELHVLLLTPLSWFTWICSFTYTSTFTFWVVYVPKYLGDLPRVNQGQSCGFLLNFDLLQTSLDVLYMTIDKTATIRVAISF